MPNNRRNLYLYLGVAVLAVVLWAVGVSTTTLVTVALVGLMLVMHMGGHGGHSHGGGPGGTRRTDDVTGTRDVGRGAGGGHQH